MKFYNNITPKLTYFRRKTQFAIFQNNNCSAITIANLSGYLNEAVAVRNKETARPIPTCRKV